MRAQPFIAKFPLLLMVLSAKLFAAETIPQFNPNPTSPDSIVWRDGGIAYAATLDCITGVANGVGGYVGQLIDDPGFSQPYVGQRFYMRIGAAALASPCVGSYLGVTFIPPAGMTISPDVGYGTRCFYKPVNSSQYQEFTQYCPQPPYSIYCGARWYCLLTRQCGPAKCRTTCLAVRFWQRLHIPDSSGLQPDDERARYNQRHSSLCANAIH
jgi:hypothetical protein